MSEPFWRTARCVYCKDERASLIVVHWGFDKSGTLTVDGVCRWCLRPATITHTRREQDADIREAFNHWRDEADEEEAFDFSEWEYDLRKEDDNGDEG